MIKRDDIKWHLPGLGESWLLVVLFFISSLMAGMVITNMNLFPVTYMLSMLLPFMWVWLRGNAARKWGHITPPALDRPDFGSFGKGSRIFILIISAISISILAEATGSLIPMSDGFKELFEKAFSDQDPRILFISASILAPLLEELLCRGVILRGMLTQMKPWKAILWSAFLFAVLHANPWQGIAAIMMGSFIGWIYYRTHSLWSCIFIHFVNNTWAQVAMLLFPDIDPDATIAELMPGWAYAILLAAAVAVLTLSIYIIDKKCKKYNETLSFTVQPDIEE